MGSVVDYKRMNRGMMWTGDGREGSRDFPPRLADTKYIRLVKNRSGVSTGYLGKIPVKTEASSCQRKIRT
jgi:hypothetical protein